MHTSAITSQNSLSPFVAKAVARIALPPNSKVLDLACGYGRHAIWLASLGYCVTAVDIEAERLAEAERQWLELAAPTGAVTFVEADATRPLTISRQRFALVLVVHFGNAGLASVLAEGTAPGGYVVWDSIGGQGENWRSLPRADEIRTALEDCFALVEYRERTVGPPSEGRVAFRVLARRRD